MQSNADLFAMIPPLQPGGICRYIASRSNGGYNLKITIRPGEALHKFDIGITEMIDIDRATVEAELNEYERLGYELRSELREHFAWTV